MNRFDGKYYWIDEPLAFQRTSIVGPSGETFPRASMSFWDEEQECEFVKTFPVRIANNILELYRLSDNQGKFKIAKTGQGKESKYEVTHVPKTAKVEVITHKTIINPIMELDVNE